MLVAPFSEFGVADRELYEKYLETLREAYSKHGCDEIAKLDGSSRKALLSTAQWAEVRCVHCRSDVGSGPWVGGVASGGESQRALCNNVACSVIERQCCEGHKDFGHGQGSSVRVSGSMFRGGPAGAIGEGVGANLGASLGMGGVVAHGGGVGNLDPCVSIAKEELVDLKPAVGDVVSSSCARGPNWERNRLSREKKKRQKQMRNVHGASLPGGAGHSGPVVVEHCASVSGAGFQRRAPVNPDLVRENHEGFWNSCSKEVRQELIDSKARMHIARNLREAKEAEEKVRQMESPEALLVRAMAMVNMAEQCAKKSNDSKVAGWAQTVATSYAESIAKSAPSSVPSYASVLSRSSATSVSVDGTKRVKPRATVGSSVRVGGVSGVMKPVVVSQTVRPIQRKEPVNDFSFADFQQSVETIATVTQADNLKSMIKMSNKLHIGQMEELICLVDIKRQAMPGGQVFC